MCTGKLVACASLLPPASHSRENLTGRLCRVTLLPAAGSAPRRRSAAAPRSVRSAPPSAARLQRGVLWSPNLAFRDITPRIQPFWVQNATHAMKALSIRLTPQSRHTCEVGSAAMPRHEERRDAQSQCGHKRERERESGGEKASARESRLARLRVCQSASLMICSQLRLKHTFGHATGTHGQHGQAAPCALPVPCSLICRCASSAH